MKGVAQKQAKLTRRHNKIRARVSGTADRPRLSVYKSNRFLEAQLIDDTKANTICSGSTKEYTKAKKGGTKVENAIKLGEELASRAKAKGVTSVVFDRGGFRYTGRVAAFADAARKAGLTF